jgi:hypothetical protein
MVSRIKSNGPCLREPSGALEELAALSGGYAPLTCHLHSVSELIDSESEPEWAQKRVCGWSSLRLRHRCSWQPAFVHVYVCMYVCMCDLRILRPCMCMYACVCMCKIFVPCAYACVCMYVCLYACMMFVLHTLRPCMCMYVWSTRLCMHVYVYIVFMPCAYAYLHTHTHTHTCIPAWTWRSRHMETWASWRQSVSVPMAEVARQLASH